MVKCYKLNLIAFFSPLILLFLYFGKVMKSIISKLKPIDQMKRTTMAKKRHHYWYPVCHERKISKEASIKYGIIILTLSAIISEHTKFSYVICLQFVFSRVEVEDCSDVGAESCSGVCSLERFYTSA